MGWEFDWLAVDSIGAVAVFSTAGGGNVPSVVLTVVPEYTEAVDAIFRLTVSTRANEEPGVSDIWHEFAARGLFTYDSDFAGSRYKRVLSPALPLHVDAMDPSVGKLARKVRFDVVFERTTLFPQDLIR